MPLNPQQIAIIDWARSGRGSANIEALAGTGKTFTLEQMAAVISGRALFCAFNKSIAEEIASRLKPYRNCEGATLHSIGLRLYRKLRPGKIEIEGNKVRYLVRKHLQYARKAADIVCDAVNVAKQSGVGIDGYPHWESIGTWASIFEDEELSSELPADFSFDRAYEICKQVYAESLEMCQDKAAPVIDFNDMLLAPLVMGGGGTWMQSYDWVLVDEAQDLNETRRLLSMRVLKGGGRYVACGDPNQAIYGFAGANSDSMKLIQGITQGAVLPLSVTYRCPKSVVTVAQKWVPTYEAAEDNPEGVVRTIQHKEFWKEDFNPTTDVVLCRNTRPLVGIAKRLRKQLNIPCIVEGYSPKGLIALAERWGDITIAGFEDRLAEYRREEVGKLVAKGKEEKAEKFSERCGILLEICADLDSDDPIKRLVQQIERFFTDDDKESNQILRLCTIHRSKGREWQRVYLVGRNSYCPSPWAKDKEALQQEENLQYVAVTRAKFELVEVNVPPRKKRPEEQDWWEL